jgi:hypothetical protein
MNQVKSSNVFNVNPGIKVAQSIFPVLREAQTLISKLMFELNKIFVLTCKIGKKICLEFYMCCTYIIAP